MAYRTITLVTRNADCSRMTSEEFIRDMYNDILEAVEKYDDMYSDEYVKNEVAYRKSFIVSATNHAKRYADNKWKTQKRRDEYVNSEHSKAIDKMKSKDDGYYYGITFFDFDVEPATNGLSSNCCISVDKLTYDSLRRCFDEVCDNRYFKVANGWKLQYTASDNSVCSSFRPHIVLILDKDAQERMDMEHKKLTEDIERFYATSHYMGD